MKDAISRFVGGLKTTFWGGLSLFWLAPLIPLIAIAPEFAQHVAEIQLGMFASEEAFNAEAMSEERWFYAYFKIAGLLIAVFAAARFLGGAGKRWWDLRTIAWKQFLIALALNAAVTAIGLGAEQAFDGEVPAFINIPFQIATLPLLIYLIGPLLGDNTMTLRRAYTTGWIAAILVAIFGLLAWGPAQLVHQYNHTLALGQSEAIVWALMIWDSLLVGLMACWMGASLAAGYWLGRAPEIEGASEK